MNGDDVAPSDSQAKAENLRIRLRKCQNRRCQFLSPSLDRPGPENVIIFSMISSMHITNFRCYSDLVLNDIGRINVIVGDNGSGKTALLESIILGTGAPELIFAMQQLRGALPNSIPLPDMTSGINGTIWKEIFTGFAQDKTIKITLDGSPENKRDVEIYLQTDKDRVVALEGQIAFPMLSGSASQTQMVFETKDSQGHQDKLQLRFSPTSGYSIHGERTVPVASIFLHGASTLPQQNQTVQDFDTISRKKEEAKFTETIKSVFPKITELSVIGGVLHCSLPEFSERIPVSYISSGINKLLAIMLGIANQPKGVYMVDEIENGFYYLRMPQIWQAINKFSLEYEVQLFVSTHSKECLEALLPVVEKTPKDFRLIRAEVGDENVHTAEMFNGDVFRAVLRTAEVDPRSGE